MLDRFTTDILFIVIVLLITAVIGFFIGYFSRKKTTIELLPKKNDNTDHDIEIKKLKSEIRKLKSKNKAVEEDLNICIERASALMEKPPVKKKLVFNEIAAKEAFEKKVRADDLKIIEGIGPKIASILKSNNIDTWYKLSIENSNRISEILLKDGGDRYKLHNPKTWGKQASLAFEGRWIELKTLQDELIGGI